MNTIAEIDEEEADEQKNSKKELYAVFLKITKQKQELKCQKFLFLL